MEANWDVCELQKINSCIWLGAKKKADYVQILEGKMQKKGSITQKTLDYAEILAVNKQNLTINIKPLECTKHQLSKKHFKVVLTI